MRRFMLSLFAILLFAPAMAAADVPALPTSDAVPGQPNGCIKVTLCEGATATGICTRGGDQIVWNAVGMVDVKFYSLQSTGTYVVAILEGDQGHDAASGNSMILDAATLDATPEFVTLTGPFSHLWANVTTCTACVATITALGCPAAK